MLADKFGHVVAGGKGANPHRELGCDCLFEGRDPVLLFEGRDPVLASAGAAQVGGQKFLSPQSMTM